MKIVLGLLDLLSGQERKSALALWVMILVMALLDTIGVASIMPFMAVLSDPELVTSNTFLRSAYKASGRLGVENTEEFTFVLGCLVFFLLVASLAFKALTTYFQARFALMREYTIGKRLIESYLYQPYSWFLVRNSSDLGKTILSEVNVVVTNGMIPFMTLLAQGTVTFCLLSLLLLVDFQMAVIVGSFLGLTYLAIFVAMSGKLSRLGCARAIANEERYGTVSEAFGAVKEVKVRGLEPVFLGRFSKPAEIYARSQASAQVIGQIPRFVLEAIAFGGLLLVLLYLMAGGDSFTDALPIISLYVFAGYRLMPALQQVYQALTRLNYVAPALSLLHRDLNGLSVSESLLVAESPLQLKNHITLDQVSYRYGDSPNQALRDISLSIPANSRVGFVGASGGGKTTVIDVILGLLAPEKGCLRVDDRIINGRSDRMRWRRSIGYVPQSIYLSDASLSANIAFGVEEGLIDQKAVEAAAKIANLHDFIVNELPQGYLTTVGERGVRLSGGQRQRIGIARALYDRPKVLILDEATSALDNVTERLLMEALDNLDYEITIIFVAHRLSTIEKCDQIFLMERGEIAAVGSYEELMIKSPQFVEMAKKKI